MRVFAVSDLHVDFEVNRQWLAGLSGSDHVDDVLILAGDVSDSLPLLSWTFELLAQRFRKVLYVPGNHELWVARERERKSSLDKFQEVCALAARCGVSTEPLHEGRVSIVPLFGWYDDSFGQASQLLRSRWMDFRACRWPEPLREADLAQYFCGLNAPVLSIRNEIVISFSHFMPRIDLMPSHIPREKRIVFPVLGTTLLEQQLRQIGSNIHVYGHSHVNRRVTVEGTLYVNSAFGYPDETRISAKQLARVYTA